MAFLSQDLYFQRQELKCTHDFLLLGTRPDCNTSPAATQTANREMLCSLEHINIPLCGQVMVLCQLFTFLRAFTGRVRT